MSDPAIQVDVGKLYHPVHLTCKFKVDGEMALRCQRYGAGLYRGKPIGKVPDLWPHLDLKQQALWEAKTFLGHMRRQGYQPQQAESEMELWGPYREKLNMAKGAELVNIEEGNHTIPEGLWGSAAYGGWTHDGHKGPRQLDRNAVLDSQDWKHGVVFLIRGRFLATRGKREETTGTIIV